MKKTLILGATPNASRYAYKAAHMLKQKGHEIINVGTKPGEVAGVKIEPAEIVHNDVDTVTMYVGATNQPPLYNYILETKPRRVIFNPGAENGELEDLLEQNGILPVHACTLVLLSTGAY